ncbi:MAG TPA: hypothetical protein VIJ18_05860 [Microbacteriaceae bacterium]
MPAAIDMTTMFATPPLNFFLLRALPRVAVARVEPAVARVETDAAGLAAFSALDVRATPFVGAVATL